MPIWDFMAWMRLRTPTEEETQKLSISSEIAQNQAIVTRIEERMAKFREDTIPRMKLIEEKRTASHRAIIAQEAKIREAKQSNNMERIKAETRLRDAELKAHKENTELLDGYQVQWDKMNTELKDARDGLNVAKNNLDLIETRKTYASLDRVGKLSTFKHEDMDSLVDTIQAVRERHTEDKSALKHTISSLIETPPAIKSTASVLPELDSASKEYLANLLSQPVPDLPTPLIQQPIEKEKEKEKTTKVRIPEFYYPTATAYYTPSPPMRVEPGQYKPYRATVDE